MGINKGEHFSERDIFIDYPFENVMFRWDHVQKEIFVKFYDESECTNNVPHDNRLFNDALRFGDEISENVYHQGKQLNE